MTNWMLLLVLLSFIAQSAEDPCNNILQGIPLSFQGLLAPNNFNLTTYGMQEVTCKPEQSYTEMYFCVISNTKPIEQVSNETIILKNQAVDGILFCLIKNKSNHFFQKHVAFFVGAAPVISENLRCSLEYLSIIICKRMTGVQIVNITNIKCERLSTQKWKLNVENSYLTKKANITLKKSNYFGDTFKTIIIPLKEIVSLSNFSLTIDEVKTNTIVVQTHYPQIFKSHNVSIKITVHLNCKWKIKKCQMTFQRSLSKNGTFEVNSLIPHTEYELGLSVQAEYSKIITNKSLRFKTKPAVPGCLPEPIPPYCAFGTNLSYMAIIMDNRTTHMFKVRGKERKFVFQDLKSNLGHHINIFPINSLGFNYKIPKETINIERENAICTNSDIVLSKVGQKKIGIYSMKQNTILVYYEKRFRHFTYGVQWKKFSRSKNDILNGTVNLDKNVEEYEFGIATKCGVLWKKCVFSQLTDRKVTPEYQILKNEVIVTLDRSCSKIKFYYKFSILVETSIMSCKQVERAFPEMRQFALDPSQTMVTIFLYVCLIPVTIFGFVVIYCFVRYRRRFTFKTVSDKFIRELNNKQTGEGSLEQTHFIPSSESNLQPDENSTQHYTSVHDCDKNTKNTNIKELVKAKNEIPETSQKCQNELIIAESDENPYKFKIENCSQMHKQNDCRTKSFTDGIPYKLKFVNCPQVDQGNESEQTQTGSDGITYSLMFTAEQKEIDNNQ
ncbi:DgyrCDS8494 [Dimorphilus gyrociliatus]|uniref:DgyrCDS8494 n=1 Tax=Dimorphilus gyrociliatus TaxID=2664684 RepID=A0A7I8VWM2_9ANNE|nr:DgyrCDS8494 [Dimorphilus gyrociliatus]